MPIATWSAKLQPDFIATSLARSSSYGPKNGLRRCHQLLEYLVMTMEASRKDWLKDLELTVNVGSPEWWARVS